MKGIMKKWNHLNLCGSAVIAFGLCAVLVTLAAAREPAGHHSREVFQEAEKLLLQTYGDLPLAFEANQGQAAAQVKFLSRGRGYSLFLTPAEVVLALSKPVSPTTGQKPGEAPTMAGARDTDVPAPTVLRMKFLGANPSPRVVGLEELPGKINYFIGSDPKTWRTNIPTYRKVVHQDVYPGIDLVSYGNNRRLEYDLVVAPGADPKIIRLDFEGAHRLELDARGDLIIHTAGGEIRQRKPLVYQEINGTKQPIQGDYVLNGKHEVGFQVAAYDAARPLVIDPVLVYSTYLGGNERDVGNSIALDNDGNIYVTGRARSIDFPTANPFQATYGGGDFAWGEGDAFVTKLNADGTALVYSTYLGGSSLDNADGIAVDANGNAYVTGMTNSSDFPGTAESPIQSTFDGSFAVFVTKLNPDGNALVYSTYLGGAFDSGEAIAVDAEGNAYVTGQTVTTSGFTGTEGSPIQATSGGGFDAFVTKVNPDGTALVYSTYLGGNKNDKGSGIAVDGDGNAYVTGETSSADFPGTAGSPIQATFGGYRDAFVARVDAAGTALVYSTYLGGNDREGGSGIAADASGNAYVTGWTDSSDFPTMSPIQPVLGGPRDVFVAKLNSAGSALVFSTYLGGDDSDIGSGIAADADGNAYVTGYTYSADFPTVNPIQPVLGGPTDVFVAKLNSAGSSLVFSTYLGGDDSDIGYGIAADACGNAYMTGWTYSNDFPGTEGSPIQSALSGYSDAFVAKISVDASDLPSFSVFAFNSVFIAQGATINSGNIGVQDASPGPWLDSQSEVSVGQNVSVADCISVYGDTLKVKSGASVYDLHYNELNNNGTIRGDEYTPLELPLDVDLPEFPTPSPGTDDYDIPSGETLILDPGSYGEVLVRQNATLILTGGIYHLENLDLGDNNSEVLFQGPTDLIINNRLEPGQNALIGPEDGSDISARDICIYVNGINGNTGALGATPKAAQIGNANTVRANICAPNGTLLIKQGTVAEGAFIGKDVKVGENVQVTLDSAFVVPYGEVTARIFADPPCVLPGESSVLSWSSTYADSAAIDQGIGDVPVEGSTTVWPTETTTYTITVTGPEGTATNSVTVSVNVADLSSFSVFAFNSVWMAQGATINSGNIGVRDASPGPWLDSQSEVSVGNNVYVGDCIYIFGDSIKVKSGSSVDDVYYNELNNNGTIRGDEYTPLELPLDVDLPEFPTPSPGTDDYDIPSGETLILGPGSYGEIIVRQNATLILMGGTYHLENLDLGSNNSEVLFQGPTDLIINNRLEPGQNALIGPGDGSDISARDICIYVNGINGNTGALGATPKAAVIGYDNTLRANIYAPNGTLWIKEGTVAEGAFIGRDVKIGENVRVTLNSGFEEPYGEVTVSISAAPSSILLGETSTLSWSSTNADTCVIEPDIGSVDPGGSIAVSPTATTTYTITATGPAGTATDSVMVTVTYPEPTVSISADPSSILLGESSTLSWTSTNADSAAIDQGIGGVPVSGSTTVSPTETTTYTITVTGPGGTATDSITVNVTIPAPIVSISADPETILLGESSTLSWSSTNADSATIDQGIGAVPVEGSTAVSPTATTTYTITVTGPGGTATDSVMVTVTYPAPTVSISADPETIVLGESSTLSWTSTNADSATIDQGIGDVPVEGSTSVSPTAATTYTITVTGPGGTATDSITVNVTIPAPTVSISATPETILFGETSTLSWTSTNADSAAIDQGIGDVPISGSTTVSPTRTTTYTITVTGPGGTATDQALVTVKADVEPQPEGSFGEQYEDLIPPDATLDSYDSNRFSLITGLVQNLEGSPIADVEITIHDHTAEYGTAITDAEGRFSIPTEGGGVLIVVYEKDGLLTAQRKVYVPWNDIAIAETIVMIPQDPASTTLTFDGNPDTVVAHQSTEVADEFGTRSCTVVFTGDNHAYEVDAAGNIIQELTTITTRATEFTTPESMPAKLPPLSLYTYCVELSVDGAQRVKFDKPIITWADNFLGFDVGEAVPVGYYDRDRGVWVPSDNGVVVKLLDTDTDGGVDALDATGDDQPDDLNNNGSFSDEVMGLSNAQRYPPGSSFWRVAVTHFSPWDYNWPYGPPPDAIGPNNPPGGPSHDGDEEYCLTPMSSYVTHRGRVFHEDIPIPGTDVTLHYANNRAQGYQNVITVLASGETVPASLKRIIVKIEMAGRTFEQILDPLPNQVAEFVWDGLDHLGRPVSGSTIVRVSVGFVYDAVYLTAGGFARAFGQAGGEWTGISARQGVVSWKRSDLIMYRTSTRVGILADGWTLSAHHSCSPKDLSILYKGDGTIINNAAISIINTVAGNGGLGYSGDGGQATEAQLAYPDGVAVDASGNLYIADSANDCIRKVDPNGIITTVAGRGNPPDGLGDGGPATEAALVHPQSVAVDAWGNLYIADSHNTRIRKVDMDGIITTVAGTGSYGYGGDGGPAAEAHLNYPDGVAADAWGNLYIADRENHRIRKVDTSGIIITVAGNGSLGYSGDGGSATDAQLNYPDGVAVDAWGNLYIADTYNYCIRKVDTSGIITTVAGNGSYGYSGDGGPATEAQLYWPKDVAVDALGNLYIADAYNNRIRKVDKDGIITTVAGAGWSGASGDGVPATEALLYWPESVAVDAWGNLYIANLNNHWIRKVDRLSGLVGFITAEGITFTEEEGLGYVMTPAGRHKWTIDLDTRVVLREFGYDENGNLTSITDQFGNQTTIARDGSGLPTAITSPDGITTALTIDPNNHLTRITYPEGSFYGFEYTPGGLMTAKVEPEDNRFEHTFNSTGKVTDVTDQEGGHWQFSRSVDENGDILSEVLTAEGDLTSYLDHYASTGAYTSTITDPTGAQTVFARSDDGLSVDKSLPCGMELAFKQDVDPEYKFKYVKEMTESTPSGLERIISHERTYQDTDADEIPDRITDQFTLNGQAITLETDALLSKKTLTWPEGRTVTAQYDPTTLLTTALSIPGLHDTAYGYDPKGRLTSISTNTRETTFSYNPQGFLESITDPENHTTSYSYDAVGRMTGIGRPDGSSLGFTYDKNGNMTVLTNPSTIDHGFGYNGVNLNTSYQTPISGTYSYIYDRDRRLTGINFPSGKQISLIYDNGRPVQIQTPEGDIDLAYLCGTKVGSITKGAEAISLGYDGSLIISEISSGTLNQTLGYTYNNDFNLTGFTYAGDTASYTYDNDGLLTDAGSFTITRNAGNGLPETVTGGALTLTRSFNGYGEVESNDFTISGSSLTSWTLTRDDAGRITNKAETVEGTTSNYTYTYDPMGRLLTVTKDGSPVEEYQYGPNGTRTYEMNSLRGIGGRTLTYSDEDHLLTAGSTTYQYDPDGFLTNKTNGTNLTSYNYSSLGELLRVELPDGKVIEYVHDSIGRKIAKKVDGVIVEKYLWRGLTRLLAVYDGSDNLVMRFEYADGRMPVAMTRGGSTYYLTYDQVGSLRAVADASGSVVKRIDYDSFGNIINDSDPAFEIPFGFAGGLHDRDTGLVRFGYRDYDPDIGRWTAKDPILFAGGSTDLYGYCLNEPISLVDSDGLSLKNVLKTLPEVDGGTGAPDVLFYMLKKMIEGTAEGLKGFKVIASRDYKYYMDMKKQTGRGMHMGKDTLFKCVDWPQYGKTFEEAWGNWLKAIMEGKFKPCE